MARPVKNLIQVLSTGHGAGRPSRARTVAATPSLGNSGRTALGGEARVSSILPTCTLLLSGGLGYTPSIGLGYTPSIGLGYTPSIQSR